MQSEDRQNVDEHGRADGHRCNGRCEPGRRGDRGNRSFKIHHGSGHRSDERHEPAQAVLQLPEAGDRTAEAGAGQRSRDSGGHAVASGQVQVRLQQRQDERAVHGAVVAETAEEAAQHPADGHLGRTADLGQLSGPDEHQISGISEGREVSRFLFFV